MSLVIVYFLLLFYLFSPGIDGDLIFRMKIFFFLCRLRQKVFVLFFFP